MEKRAWQALCSKLISRLLLVLYTLSISSTSCLNIRCELPPGNPKIPRQCCKFVTATAAASFLSISILSFFEMDYSSCVDANALSLASCMRNPWSSILNTSFRLHRLAELMAQLFTPSSARRNLYVPSCNRVEPWIRMIFFSFYHHHRTMVTWPFRTALSTSSQTG